MPFSLSQRQQMHARLQTEMFDLLVIGGGITAAGIARDAALRGYRVVLLEQEDFGFGTSSRSSRLIHGGVRYLEHGHLGLVFESLSERTRLARLARHLVRPLPFVFPVYQGGRSLLTVNLGLWLYDTLALFRNYRRHKRLSALGVQTALPGIRTQGLLGGVHYYDYQTDDARLVLENVLSAVTEGAVALSYVHVDGYERSACHTFVVHARDRLTTARVAVRSRAVVSAVGPWTDLFLTPQDSTSPYLNCTKGMHLVLSRESLPIEAAVVMQHPQDGRVLFALPYQERVVLGTTDTPFSDDPASVMATAADVHYLLDAARHYFPQLTLGPDEVMATWAGVRPLLHQKETAGASAASRDYRIDIRPDGVVMIAGGKLTTFRRMAAACVDVVAGRIARASGPAFPARLVTQRVPLPGARGLRSDADLDALMTTLTRAGSTPSVARHLAHTYGARAEQVMALAQQERLLLRPIIDGLPFVWAEITFAVCEEMALTLADVLVRRIQIFYRAHDQGLSIAERVAAHMAPSLGWDAAEQAQQVQAYRDLVARNQQWQNAL